jgi:hypothetical protein
VKYCDAPYFWGSVPGFRQTNDVSTGSFGIIRPWGRPARTGNFQIKQL